MAAPDPARVIVIAGPTASGKSALALDLAERLHGVIVNADSMQVYRELAILTARPDTRGTQVPHHLYGHVPAAEPYSVGRWRAEAEDAIDVAGASGRPVFVVGGSGLHLWALMHGLADVPEIPSAIRRQARALHARLGGDAFHAALAARDPGEGARLRASDSQRLMRAWEVLEATGRPLSAWHGPPPPPSSGPRRFASIVLEPSRAALYDACNARFERMLDAGALEEVRGLRTLGIDPTAPAMKALGVAELSAYLDGRLSRAAAIAAAQQATRRYAKRQLTWFRHRLRDATRLTAATGDSALVERVHGFLLTGRW